MITSILITHIVAMTFSLILTMTLFAVAAFGRRTVKSARIANRIITGLGVLAGVVLLVQHPILSTCVTLTAYVLAFGAAEYYIQKRVARSVSA